MIYLTISHNLALDRSQRYEIAENDNSTVKVIGASVPVWCYGSLLSIKSGLRTNEPAEEVFCEYLITNLNNDHIIKMMERGYEISLPTNSIRRQLKDVKDGGSECITFSHSGEIIIQNLTYRVIHFVNILDEEKFSSTLTTDLF